MNISVYPFLSKLTKYTPSLVGFCVAIIIAYYAISTPLNKRIIDWKVYDLYTESSKKNFTNNSIVIIDIDDQSLAEIGQWPWPRFHLANALRIITEGRPSSVLMDILLSEKDRTSLVNIQELFASEFSVNLDLSSIPTILEDYDEYLSQVIKGTPIILPLVLTQQPALEESLCINKQLESKQDNVNIDNNTGIHPMQYQGVICPLNRFYQNSAATGFINATVDEDGLVRRIPILKQYKDQLIPGLSLAGLSVITGANYKIESNRFGSLIKLNQYQIPIDEMGNALINFNGKGRHYETISILKLLNGAISSDYFTGKIVLVGATASALNNVSNTYVDSAFPNIELHATLIDNVLSHDLLKVPTGFEKFESTFIILMGAMLALLMMRKRFFALNVFAILLLVLLIVLPAISLYLLQLYFSPFLAIMSLMTVFIVMVTLKHYAVESELVSAQYSITNTNLSIIDSMAAVAEVRDSETGGHIIRTRMYVKTLVEHLQTKDKYKHQINDDYIRFISAAAPLHDIGKVGIPDHILLKPGKLTAEELVIMRTHATIGGNILRQTINKVGTNPYLNIAIEIANYHHEKWDGTGYPLGLKGEAIPLSARVMAIADVFDALINKRIYKNAVSFEDTFNYIQQASGTHFDPDVVNAFIEIKKDLLHIARTIHD